MVASNCVPPLRNVGGHAGDNRFLQEKHAGKPRPDKTTLLKDFMRMFPIDALITRLREPLTPSPEDEALQESALQRGPRES